eukprot:3223633-Amphidinium_carterae.1
MVYLRTIVPRPLHSMRMLAGCFNANSNFLKETSNSPYVGPSLAGSQDSHKRRLALTLALLVVGVGEFSTFYKEIADA